MGKVTEMKKRFSMKPEENFCSGLNDFTSLLNTLRNSYSQSVFVFKKRNLNIYPSIFFSLSWVLVKCPIKSVVRLRWVKIR